MLSEIRQNWTENGKVDGVLADGTAWTLKLGIWNNGELTLLEEGAFRFHPSQPIVSLWCTFGLLQEYERRCKVNADCIATTGISPMRAPYSPLELRDMASAALTLDLEEIGGMVEKERVKKGPLKRSVPFVRRQGYVPALEIVFQSPSEKPSVQEPLVSGGGDSNWRKWLKSLIRKV